MAELHSMGLRSMQDSQQQQSPSIEDCLKLLEGDRDEQRFAGLLLVTKFCKGNDLASISRVYDAVGVQFLDRLLRTGMGKGASSGSGGDNRDAYLQLAVTILASFCRSPEIASSQYMISNIALILEIMSSKESVPTVLNECYEFLFLVSTACEDGVRTLHESGGLKVIASQMSTLPDGSHQLELAMKLVQLMLSKYSTDIINTYVSELSMVVITVARQFALSHNALKFEALHLLSGILSSQDSAPVRDALRVMPDENWSSDMRVGIVAILQNRVGHAEKLQALVLAESMIAIKGEGWLIGQVKLHDVHECIPGDRCLLLVLETSRVEVAVLLNELAYLKFEASKNSSTADTILLKQRNLAIAFLLVEKIIKLISNACGNEGDLISDSTFTKVISGLNETIDVVLEYLKDAKDHGQKKGDDLLASVRIVGNYLSEAPLACEEKVGELLEYMLSIEGQDESSPFYSVCFLLPLVCQMTMKVEGCKSLASSRGYIAVVECLIKLIGPKGATVEDNSCIFLACDTILNLLLKREQVQVPLDESTLVYLLKALTYWTGRNDDPTIVMMVASICALILDYTSEEDLRNHPNFGSSSLDNLIRLIVKSMATSSKDMSDDNESDSDLLDIVTTGYSRWAHRFPHIKEAVER